MIDFRKLLVSDSLYLKLIRKISYRAHVHICCILCIYCNCVKQFQVTAGWRWVCFHSCVNFYMNQLWSWNCHLHGMFCVDSVLLSCARKFPKRVLRNFRRLRFPLQSSRLIAGFNKRHYCHYCEVIMGAMASQITSLTIYLTLHSGTDHRKHQRSASLAFVRGIHRWPVNSLHKWPVTRKMFPFDDVIM